MSASLDGVTLHVADVEVSLAFYQQLLPDATLAVHRPGQFGLLMIGESRLGLLREGTHQFHVEIGSDNVDAVYTRLVAAGIATDGPPRERWNDRNFIVTDPDGYQIEFGA